MYLQRKQQNYTYLTLRVQKVLNIIEYNKENFSDWKSCTE